MTFSLRSACLDPSCGRQRMRAGSAACCTAAQNEALQTLLESGNSLPFVMLLHSDTKLQSWLGQCGVRLAAESFEIAAHAGCSCQAFAWGQTYAALSHLYGFRSPLREAQMPHKRRPTSTQLWTHWLPGLLPGLSTGSATLSAQLHRGQLTACCCQRLWGGRLPRL